MKRKKRHGKHDKRDRRVTSRRFVLMIAGVACMLALLYIGGSWLEARNKKPETRGDYQERYAYEETINVDGVTYRRRREVTAILLMGVDRSSDAAVTGYRNGGQSDFLQVLAIDSANRTITRVPIDRDTMTPITVLGVLGNKSGVRTAQICLSHGFGDGKQQSCELTVDAVSNLLMGVPIDEYFAMNLDGISTLNDALGGVTVTLEDDFSAVDPAMTPGTTLTLRGMQAEYFVRSRMNIGVGTNEARMKRQHVFLEQMGNMLIDRVNEDQNFIGTLYDELEPYLVTSMSRGYLINKAWTARAYDRTIAEIPGEHRIGENGFMEFHADETAIEQLVLELFYQKVK